MSMGDDENGEDGSKDIQQSTDEKARVADTPDEDPRGSDSSGNEED